jgi:O-antigen ligase
MEPRKRIFTRAPDHALDEPVTEADTTAYSAVLMLLLAPIVSALVAEVASSLPVKSTITLAAVVALAMLAPRLFNQQRRGVGHSSRSLPLAAAAIGVVYFTNHGLDGVFGMRLLTTVAIGIAAAGMPPAVYLKAMERIALFVPLSVAASILLTGSGAWQMGRLGGSFHPQGLGLLLIGTAPFLLTRKLDLRDDRLRIAALVAMSATLLATRSRTGLTGGIVVALLVWLRPWDGISIAKVQRFAVLIGAGALLAQSEDVQNFIRRGESTRSLGSLTGRTAIWDLVFGAIASKLWIGNGETYTVKVWNRIAERYSNAYGAHNLYLSLLSRYGLICAVLIALVFLAAFGRIWGLVRKSSDAVARRAFVAVALSLSTSVVASLTEHNVLDVFFPWGMITWCNVAWVMTQPLRPGRSLGVAPVMQRDF